MLQKWSKTHIFKNTPTGAFEIEPARNQFKLVQHSEGFFRIIFWTSWKEMARKILSTKKYQKYKSVEFADRLIDTGIMMHFKNGQMYGYFWEIISIIKRDMFCKIKDRHCIRSQWKGERLPTVRRRPWSVWGWERGKSKVFRCLTDGGVSQPNVKIGWKLQRIVEEENFWKIRMIWERWLLMQDDCLCTPPLLWKPVL